jgi:hypothetical protein
MGCRDAGLMSRWIVGPFIIPLHFPVFMSRQPSPVVPVVWWNVDYQLCGVPDDQPRGQ